MQTHPLQRTNHFSLPSRISAPNPRKNSKLFQWRWLPPEKCSNIVSSFARHAGVEEPNYTKKSLLAIKKKSQASTTSQKRARRYASAEFYAAVGEKGLEEKSKAEKRQKPCARYHNGKKTLMCTRAIVHVKVPCMRISCACVCLYELCFVSCVCVRVWTFVMHFFFFTHRIKGARGLLY